jgi:uncharacterized protein (TIGR00290 family)
MKEYDDVMRLHMQKLKSKGITHTIFGDIFLEDLRAYREARLAEIGMKGLFPLWKRDTKELVNEFINLGFKTILVCTQSRLEDFLGRIIDPEFIKELPHDVDVCGENGEFHTFAFDGPIFRVPIHFLTGEKVFKEFAKPKDKKDTCFTKDNNKEEKSGYWYVDLV